MKSLAELLRYRVRLRPGDVVQLLVGITGRLRTLQRGQTGRSHGNLTAAGVSVVSKARLNAAEVQVTGQAAETGTADELERADLRAIGLLLYQVVRCRGLMAEEELERLTNAPEPTIEWRAVFGDDAPKWVALCNRLLDPALSLSDCSLATLEADLLALQPKSRLGRLVIPLLAILLLALAGATAWWFWLRKGRLVITSNLPGATVLVEDRAGHRLRRAMPAGGDSLRLSRPPGAQSIEVQFTNLAAVRTNVTVLSRQRTEVKLNLAFGGLVIQSEPAGARVELLAGGDQPTTGEVLEGFTPYTNDFLPPRTNRFVLNLVGFEPADTNLTVVAGTTRVAAVKLVPTSPEATNLVTVRVVPALATIAYGADEKQGSIRKRLPTGRHSFTARLAPGFMTNYELRVPPVGSAGFETNFTLPYAVLNIRSTPADATVYAAGSNLVGQTPLVDRAWPLGVWDFEVRKDGYSTNRFHTNLVGELPTPRWDTVLEPLGGIVELAANVPDAFASNLTLSVLSNDLPVRTESPLPAQIRLDRGAYTLMAGFSNLQAGVLAPVSQSVSVEPNTTNQARFDFAFGQVRLVTRLPQAVIELETAGGAVLGSNTVTRLQRPDAPESYLVRADRYHPTNLTVTVTQSQTLELPPIELAPVLYHITFVLDPPDATLSTPANQPAEDDLGWRIPAPRGSNSFRWETGRRDYLLTHPNLPSQPVQVGLRDAMTNGVTWPTLAMPHARLGVQTAPRGLTAEVLSNETILGRLTTPVTNYVLRPNQPLTLRIRNPREVLTNWSVPPLAEGTNLMAKFAFLPALITNSLPQPMVLRRVDHFYISESAVTSGQFLTLMSNQLASEVLDDLADLLRGTTHTNASDAAECVTWEEADRFCRALNDQDLSRLSAQYELDPGWSYALPSVAEYQAAAPPQRDFLASWWVADDKTNTFRIRDRQLRAPLNTAPRRASVGFHVVLRGPGQ